MSVQVEWDNPEQSILRYIFDDGWTWEDFFAAREEALRLIDERGAEVGVIIHMPEHVRIPPNLITHARSLAGRVHENTVMVMVVMSNHFLRVMLQTLRKISPQADSRMHMAQTLDEARATLNERLGNKTQRP